MAYVIECYDVMWCYMKELWRDVHVTWRDIDVIWCDVTDAISKWYGVICVRSIIIWGVTLLVWRYDVIWMLSDINLMWRDIGVICRDMGVISVWYVWCKRDLTWHECDVISNLLVCDVIWVLYRRDMMRCHTKVMWRIMVMTHSDMVWYSWLWYECDIWK